MQAIIEKLGINPAHVIWAVSLLVLLVLIWIVTRFIFGNRIRATAAGRTRQPRLGVVDAYDLDRQRQLVLVRRDNVEHLLMIGGPNDVLVESTIVRAAIEARPRQVASGDDTLAPTPQIGALAPAALPAMPPIETAFVRPPPPTPSTPGRPVVVGPPQAPPAPPPPPSVRPPGPASMPLARPLEPAASAAPTVEDAPAKPRFEFPRFHRPAESSPDDSKPMPVREPPRPAAEPPRPVAPPLRTTPEAPKPVLPAARPPEPAKPAFEVPKPMEPPRPAAEAQKPVFEPPRSAPGGARPTTEKPPATAARPADPLEALEEEMAKLLGRPPSSGAPKN